MPRKHFLQYRERLCRRGILAVILVQRQGVKIQTKTCPQRLPDASGRGEAVSLLLLTTLMEDRTHRTLTDSFQVPDFLPEGLLLDWGMDPNWDLLRAASNPC